VQLPSPDINLFFNATSSHKSDSSYKMTHLNHISYREGMAIWKRESAIDEVINVVLSQAMLVDGIIHSFHDI
jgi:hypothetical protein